MGLTKQQKMAVLGIGLGEAVIAMDFSIVSTALSSIQKDMLASTLQLQWILNILGLFLPIFLVTGGRLADMYGRRRLYLIGVIGIGIASLGCGLAPQTGWIIAFQGLEGIAGAIVLPVSQALLAHAFPPEQRSRAIAIWATIAGLTLALGPIVGGILISIGSWRLIFLINVPIVIVAVIFILRGVKESKSRAKEELDLLGLLFLSLTIASLLLAIIQGPVWGWSSYIILGLFALFVVSLAILIWVEAKARFPIIRPGFFFNHTFLYAALCNYCVIFSIWSAFFFLPLYFQNTRQLSPLVTGVAMLLVSMPLALFAGKMGKLYHTTGPRKLLIMGFIVFLICAILQLCLESTSSIYLPLLIALCVGIGWVFIMGPATTAAISALPIDAAGVASGAFTTVQEIGGATGLALTGTFFRMGDDSSVLQQLQQRGIQITVDQKEHIKSLLSDTGALKAYVAQNFHLSGDAFIPIFKEAFVNGYHHASWILLLVAFIGLLSAFGVKKTKTKMKRKST